MALLASIMATLLVIATALAFTIPWLSAALAEPSAPLLVAEHNDVLAGLEHELEVAPLDGLLGPPAIEHAPLFADERDPETVDEPRRPVESRLDERRLRLVQSSRGTNSARASGIRDHGATSTTDATEPEPVLART